MENFKNKQTSKLFMTLPDYICTPDGMAIGPQGDLVLSCPNFADDRLPGCIVKIDRQRNIKKWFDVPVPEDIGIARTMGIAFDENGTLYAVDNPGWLGRPELEERGRILSICADENGITGFAEVAVGMEHPNGIRIRGEYMYVTQSLMSKVKREDGKVVSAVYRFHLSDRGIKVNNTLDDPNILTVFITNNENCQYGADGIEFDSKGNLYVGNFGDGAVHKITFDETENVKSNEVWAKDAKQLKSTDGIVRDEQDNLYVADFSANAVAKITPDGNVTRIAQSADSNGLNGELDQPGEPIVWDGKLIVSCFDLVTDDDKVNTAHEMPATLAYLEM